MLAHRSFSFFSIPDPAERYDVRITSTASQNPHITVPGVGAPMAIVELCLQAVVSRTLEMVYPPCTLSLSRDAG